MALGPSRRSARGKDKQGVSFLKMAQHLTADKNLERPGNPFPKYSVLHDYSDDHICKIISDCSIVLNGGSGEGVGMIEMIRAKELTQAALAEAASKKEEALRTATAAREAQRATDRESMGAQNLLEEADPSAPSKNTAVGSKGVQLRKRII